LEKTIKLAIEVEEIIDVDSKDFVRFMGKDGQRAIKEVFCY
jgi:hypothetical protein